MPIAFWIYKLDIGKRFTPNGKVLRKSVALHEKMQTQKQPTNSYNLLGTAYRR